MEIITTKSKEKEEISTIEATPVISDELKNKFKESMPPDEISDATVGEKSKTKESVEEKEEREEKARKEALSIKINEMVSFVDKKQEEAKKERAVRDSIFKTLKVAFSNTIFLPQFFKEFKSHLEVWARNPNFEEINMDELKSILEQAKADKYQGSLAAEKSTSDGKVYKMVYASKKQTGRSVNATKV